MSRIESLQGLHPIEDIKTVLGPCLGVTGSVTSFVVPTQVQKYDFTAKLGTAEPKNSTYKINPKILGSVFPFVKTI